MAKPPGSVMERIVALCKRRGFIFQSSEIYGGIQGFWDYGPLGVELKRNIKNAWWNDMVHHPPLGPGDIEFQMVGLDCAIIMHPQVWKCSGHFDLFSDMMVDCRTCKGRFRADQISRASVRKCPWDVIPATLSQEQEDVWLTSPEISSFTCFGDNHDEMMSRHFKRKHRAKIQQIHFPRVSLGTATVVETDRGNFFVLHGLQSIDWTAPDKVPCPFCEEIGQLTEPRPFNLMFESHSGPVKDEENKVFLRPETAQGIFVNFKNVIDSTRVKIPFGIAQVGKSFRNEITPRNYIFRSREFEQMEIEFFCHPDESERWYQYWRDMRMKWYTDLGLASEKLRLREHEKEELSHYSRGTADVEYAFPFLADGEFGELEGVAHRGDFDLRSHMEGKLDPDTNPLELEKGPDGKPVHKGSGKDLTYFDPERNERFTPHVIEPSAGADRATLAFICEAYTVDESRPSPEFMRFHPRLAPIKAAVFPLVAKDDMPEIAERIYQKVRKRWPAQYDAKQSIGKRYARMDEAGTPYCFTIDGQTKQDETVTVRDRDTGHQERIKEAEVENYLAERLGG